MKATNAFVGGITSLALTLACAGITAQANAETGQEQTAVSSAAEIKGAVMSDEEFDELIRVLDQLPTELKNADPKTTPNYEARISAAVDAVRAGRTPSSSLPSLPAETVSLMSWWSCGLAIASFVGQYGIPFGKIIGWLKKAKKIYGTVKGILWAIKHGVAAAQIGNEAAKMLEALLGFDSIKSACFG